MTRALALILACAVLGADSPRPLIIGHREVLDLAEQLGRQLGRPVGVYPETKHPTFFRGIGLPIEEKLLASLRAHGWDSREAPVFIQSFESGNLKALRPKTRVRLIYLVADPRLVAGDLAEIAAFADGTGPDKRLLLPVHGDGTLGEPTDMWPARMPPGCSSTPGRCVWRRRSCPLPTRRHRPGRDRNPRVEHAVRGGRESLGRHPRSGRRSLPGLPSSPYGEPRHPHDSHRRAT